MSKSYFILILFFLNITAVTSQTEKKEIYDPQANAMDDIANAVAKAGSENKHVLLQVGGNWCGWCIRFHAFVNDDPKIDSVIRANYIYLLVNYSKENKNLDILEKLEFPQRFGFPVLVILDHEGNRIHTQNSAYLEKDKSYDRDKVMEFLKQWSPAALDSEKYN
jgi:thioredoxin-related protein